jgi:hypothetical protein
VRAHRPPAREPLSLEIARHVIECLDFLETIRRCDEIRAAQRRPSAA